MDDNEDQSAPNQSGAAPNAAATGTVGQLTRLPDSEWLDEVDSEISDIELVLKCLARDSATLCRTCSQLRADGSLESRPALDRCASGKSPT